MSDVQQYDALTRSLAEYTRLNLYRACAGTGLTPTQYLALGAIARMGTARMSDLSTSLHLTPGAATTLVDRLHRHGLIAREADPSDRRVVLVQLSEKGTASLSRTSLLEQEAKLHAFSQLPPHTQQHLTEGLSALIEVWSTMTQEPRP